MTDTDQNPPTAQYEPLPLEKLMFDVANPRFARGPVPEDEGGPLGYLAMHSNLLDLMQSIAAQGFFPGEPIMVVSSGEQDDKYRVIEGNRRVAACRLLSHPDEAPEKIRSTMRSISDNAQYKPLLIPALKFEHETDILRYLGYRHISGVQEWSPLAKARYVKRLFGQMAPESSEANRLSWVGERIGANAAYVARLMTSLKLYERSIEKEFYGLEIQPEELSFSLLTVAISRRAVTGFLRLQTSKDFHADDLNEDALKQLLDWMFVKQGEPPRTVLGDSRNMKFLAEVLADESGNALEVLNRTRDLEEAYSVAIMDEDAVIALAREALAALEEMAELVHSEKHVLSFEELTELAAIESVLTRLKVSPIATVPKDRT